jgi:hypothetical protein
MKYVIIATEFIDDFTIIESFFYTNLKKAIIGNKLNYGTFLNWKSKNKIDYPIFYKGFLFEKIEVK